MKKAKITIESLFGGSSDSRYLAKGNQFESSSGIDFDLPVGANEPESGLPMPTMYDKISGVNVNDVVIAIITCPKSTKVFVVLGNGRLISYTSSLGSETLVGTCTGNHATGATYYNNYIYIFGTGAAKDDVSRYGPLNNSPTLADSFWKTTLGLTALTDTAYPSNRLINYPNHWGMAHTDDSLYFLDFKNGQGMVHRIHTMKVTDEGDTDDTTVPSAYNVLDLSFGYYPTALASYSNYVVIAATQNTAEFLSQGTSAIFIWDPTNASSFDQKIDLPDALTTALLVKEGTLYVFSGPDQRGLKIYEYVGGDTLDEVVNINGGLAPFPGAVDLDGNRVLFGSFCTNPWESSEVYAMGTNSGGDKYMINGIMSVGYTSAAATQNVSAVKVVSRVYNTNVYESQILVGAYDDSNGYAVYARAQSDGTVQAMLKLPLVTVGRKFRIDEIKFPLSEKVLTGMSVIPTISYDRGNQSTELTEINSTNYPSVHKVAYKSLEMPHTGSSSFQISLTCSGTVQMTVAFPIEITLSVYDD